MVKKMSFSLSSALWLPSPQGQTTSVITCLPAKGGFLHFSFKEVYQEETKRWEVYVSEENTYKIETLLLV